MADLLSGKNMIFQKFTTTFIETFAGGTGPFLGGIFFGSPIHCLDCWWDGLAVSPKLDAVRAQNRIPSAQNSMPSAQNSMPSAQNSMMLK